MEGQRRALIIGVNHCGTDIGQSLRYAEHDAEALYRVLTDPKIGTFDSADVDLLVGEDAQWHEIKRRLRQIVRKSQPSDMLLVYFAGHAYVPEWGGPGDAYLATSDLDVDALADEPDSGLRMTFLRHDVFAPFRGTSFLILDCCHAGAYTASGTDQDAAASMGGSPISTHSVLLACPAGAAAREDEATRHGRLTNNLLRALRGEAAGRDGTVTFAHMADFAAQHDSLQSVGQVVQTWGATCDLARHGPQPVRTPRLGSAAPASIVVCENPLDRSASSILQLLARLFPRGAVAPRQTAHRSPTDRVEVIRQALQADAVAIVEFRPHGSTVMNSTARFRADHITAILDESRAFAYPTRSTWPGHVASVDDGVRVMCTPLGHEDERTIVLVVVQPPLAVLELGETLGVILAAVWRSDAVGDPVQSEINALTALRQSHGRLPTALYDHCFTAYRDAVSNFVIAFQPVISLNRSAARIRIESYEALARRTAEDTRAPISLLKVAHVWGDKFVVERDIVLFNKAVRGYERAVDDAGGWSAIRPVSVNVAVRSLLSDAYVEVVKGVLDDVGLNPGDVTLEISEQDPIEARPNEIWPGEPLSFFHSRLATLARSLEVGFAVDDFGVGYSSLARMAELTLTQIKVDRAILHHPLALQEIDLVMQVATHARDAGNAPTPRTVVIEGFDEHSPVTLSQLFHHKVRYVQGYVSGVRPSSVLQPLEVKACQAIAEALSIEAPARREREHGQAQPAA